MALPRNCKVITWPVSFEKVTRFIFTKLGAEGTGQGSHVIRYYVEAKRRKHGPYEKPVAPEKPIEICEGSLLRLEFSDGSELIGGLTPYGLLEPSWIRIPQYDATTIYVRMPDGYGWVSKKLDLTRDPIVHVQNTLRLPKFTFLD